MWMISFDFINSIFTFTQLRIYAFTGETAPAPAEPVPPLDCCAQITERLVKKWLAA